MIAKHLTNKVFSAIAAANATAAWNIVNYLMDECRLAHAWANLKSLENLGDRARILFILFPGPVSSLRLPNTIVANTQYRRLPKEDADQINKDSCQTDPRTI